MAPERSRPQVPAVVIKRTPILPPGAGKQIPQKKPGPISKEFVSSSTASSASENEEAAPSGSDSDSSSSDSPSGQRISRSTDSPPRRAGSKSARPTFEPPRGFRPLSTDSASSRAAKLFDPANLEGKQIWHIVAPAGVPVSTLKEVSIRKAKKGECVLSHNGADYGFAFVDEAAAGTYKSELLVPSKTGDGYQLAGLDIAQTLHLQQIVRLPFLSNQTPNQGGDASQSSKVSAPAKKPIRQQPKGLRMRYAPLGHGASASVEPYAWSSAEDGSEDSGADRLERAKKASHEASQTNGAHAPRKARVNLPNESTPKRSKVPLPNESTSVAAERPAVSSPDERVSVHVPNGFTAPPPSHKRKRREDKQNGGTTIKEAASVPASQETVEPVETDASPKKKRSKHKHNDSQEVADSQSTVVSITETGTSQDTVKDSSQQQGRDSGKHKHTSGHRSEALEYDEQGRRRETSQERARRKEKEKRRREKKEAKESQRSSQRQHSQREHSMELS